MHNGHEAKSLLPFFRGIPPRRPFHTAADPGSYEKRVQSCIEPGSIAYLTTFFPIVYTVPLAFSKSCCPIVFTLLHFKV